ncbi:hypothetical protein EJB05_10065, partial [Eragrostis curvula]
MAAVRLAEQAARGPGAWLRFAARRQAEGEVDGGAVQLQQSISIWLSVLSVLDDGGADAKGEVLQELGAMNWPWSGSAAARSRGGRRCMILNLPLPDFVSSQQPCTRDGEPQELAVETTDERTEILKQQYD